MRPGKRPPFQARVATDAAGNSATATRAFEIVADSTKPVMAISNPLAGATIPASSFNTNTVRGTATDNLAVASVAVKLYRTRSGVKEFWDGTDFVTASTAAPVTLTGAGSASASWVLSSAPTAADLDAGTYTLYATATDTSGNVSAVIVRNFSVSTTTSILSGGSFKTF